MYLSSRNLTIIFLVLLQLIAPLVHGHTNAKIFDKGVHIPGMENYGQQVLSQQHEPSYCELSAIHITEGLLVGINTGIKAKQGDASGDLENPTYLPSSVLIIKTTLSQFDANFSPHPQHNVTNLTVTSFSARAPPL
jgi:hypothetical protein